MRYEAPLPPLEAVLKPEDIAAAVASAVREKKAYDVVALDMRELVYYTDAFLLCSARSPRQVQAVAEEVRRVAKRELGVKITSVEGLEKGRWVLVDLGAIVVHVFEEPWRGFYDLDKLWSDAPRIMLPEPTEEHSQPFA